MSRRHQRGLAVMKPIGMVLAFIAAGVAIWYAYAEYQRYYWDQKVRRLCAIAGGIEVIERVTLDDRRYMDAHQNIRIPIKRESYDGRNHFLFEATADDAFYFQQKTTVIRDENPRVARDEVQVFRASDKKLLGEATSFVRVGGDAIAIDFESRLRCPVEATETDLFKAVFIVENTQGEKK